VVTVTAGVQAASRKSRPNTSQTAGKHMRIFKVLNLPRLP